MRRLMIYAAISLMPANALAEISSDDELALLFRLSQDEYLPSDRAVTKQEEDEALSRFANERGIENTPESIVSFMKEQAKGEAMELTNRKTSDDVKACVGEMLSDPFSARYRNLQHYPGRLACGQVNAKNKFGAYIGWQMFAAELPIPEDRQGKAILDESVSTPFATIACDFGIDLWSEVD